MTILKILMILTIFVFGLSGEPTAVVTILKIFDDDFDDFDDFFFSSFLHSLEEEIIYTSRTIIVQVVFLLSESCLCRNIF